MALHPQRLNLISLCTGGGGIDLGVELAMPDARTVCCVEREAFAASQLVCAIQKGLLAEAAIWSDVGTFDGRPWRGIVDGVIGGIPCQPHSLAGKRRGSDDERDLWSDARRIIVQSGAWLVLIENVPGMLSAKPGLDPGALRVRRDLQRLGFRVEAGLFTAAEVGASHKRERLFILAVADCVGARLAFRQQPDFQRGTVRDERSPALADCDGMGNAARGNGAGAGQSETHHGSTGEGQPRGSVGLFPPGPSDLSGWRHILERAPELEPAFRRVADGLASRLDVARVDRLRMLGNGVVSLEAAYAVRTLWARLGMQFMTATSLAATQPETFYFDRDRSPGVTITLPSVPIDGDRNQYLREGIASMIRRARRYVRAKDGEGTHWSQGYAGRIIEWALSLKEEGLVQATAADAEAPIDHPGREVAASIIDRVIEDSIDGHSGNLNQPKPADSVVAYLLESHRARKTFPSGHTFSMTNPVINGHMVTLGTCTCGETFSYAYGSAGHERMDAAIEAHWQKFDGVADKIDGRGFPIGEAVPPTKKSRKRKQPDAPGQPASIASAPVLVGTIGADAPLSELAEAGPHTAPRSEPAPNAPPSGAGSPIFEDAPIGAGLVASDMAAEPQDDWSELLRAATDLAWREPLQVTPHLAALLDFSKVYAAGAGASRPVLRWHGGKWKLAPWIIGHFPPHRIYVEPFGGGGSVLIRKPRVYAEVYNDLDVEVVNLFRVLRDESQAARLVDALRLTPFAREEFEGSYALSDDPIEGARRFLARSFMGFGSNGHNPKRRTGFRHNSNRSGTTPAQDWVNYPDCLHPIVERLRGVVIDNRDACEVMSAHDEPHTLHYVDPPYLPETRSLKNPYDLTYAGMYAHEMSKDDHSRLLTHLRTLVGLVVLSGYPSPQYDDALNDWRRVEVATHADGALDRTEVLWINPACAAALDQQYPALFDLGAHDVANAPPPRRQQPSGG